MRGTLTLETGTDIVVATDPADRLGTLFDRHHRRLHRLALRLSQDDADARDLVQETFLRAARRPASVPADDDAAEAWLVRVLVNLCRDRWRRWRVRRNWRAGTGRPEPEPSPESATVARTTVRAALAELAPKRRAIVVMAEIEGRTSREIAATLAIRPATVRWHLMTGRRELRRIIEEAGVASVSRPTEESHA